MFTRYWIKHKYNNMRFLISMLLCCNLMACGQKTVDRHADLSHAEYHFEIVKSAEEWRDELSPEAFKVLRESGTERPFTSKLLDNKSDGQYRCAACDLPLFASSTKFESGTGWPSFFDVIGDTNVVEHSDKSLGMVRTEVLCGRCGGHLGHVFNDGPEPTGLRYCINGVSLDFKSD